MPKKSKKEKQKLTSGSKGKVKATEAVEKLTRGKAASDSSKTAVEGIRADRGKRAKEGKHAGNGKHADEAKQAGSSKHTKEAKHAEGKLSSESGKSAKASKVAEEGKLSAKQREQATGSAADHKRISEFRDNAEAETRDGDGVSSNQLEERSRHLQESYQQLHRACEKSNNMRGKLRQQQGSIAVELPDALPSALLLRALQKNGEQYQTLTPERIAQQEHQPGQLSLHVAGLTAAQMHTFISELDELIGQFTGRN